MFSLHLAAALLAAVMVSSVIAVDITVNPTLNANLKVATSQLDRLNLLKDSDFLFDFTTKQPFYNFSPGGVINMNAATSPAMIGNGMTLAMLNLGPCSQLPPHFHPRAANIVVAVAGNTTTYMFEENGARLIKQILTPGKATIFPQGSMHMMVNNGCENAQLVSALNAEDTGTLNVGSVFTAGFPAEVVNAAFGQDIAGPGTASKITPVGTGSTWGTPECLKRCGFNPIGNGTYTGHS